MTHRPVSPRVALESTVIAHGLPHPHNLETARAMEAAVRDEGATPCTIAVLDGRVRVGLDDAELEHLATAQDIRKMSWRDLPVVLARRGDGATTVAATMWLAHRAGIGVFATGGIGGVHRLADGSPSPDVSNDLEALARVPLVVVCAGAKAVLHLSATRERLETLGVTVVGYGTDELPAFYSTGSGLEVDVRCDTPGEVAAIAQARAALGLPCATLVVVPPPADVALRRDEVEPVVTRALEEAQAQSLRSGEVTPFLLTAVATHTGGAALHANKALLMQNARVAGAIACALEAGSGAS